jgi:hypothetical protein
MNRDDPALAELFKLCKLLLRENQYAQVGDYTAFQAIGLVYLVVRFHKGTIRVASWNSQGAPSRALYCDKGRVRGALHALRRALVLDVLADT